MGAREKFYTEQLKEMGVYQPAFDAAIHELCILERELSRARKEWKATAAAGEAPSLANELYSVVRQIRSDILAHRDALGLTPKGLKRLKGKDGSAGKTAGEEITDRLDAIWDRVSSYE